MQKKNAALRRHSTDARTQLSSLASEGARIETTSHILLSDLFQTCDLVRLRSLLSFNDVEFDFIALFQAFVAVNLDRAIVHEDIRPIITPDKSVPFCVVEPLHLALVLSHVP